MSSVKSNRATTETPLTNGSTFTSGFELNNYSDALITLKSDQTGILYADFSMDGENIDSSLTYKISAGIFEIHKLVKGNRYFQIRIVNDSGSDQTYLRCHTSYGDFGLLTAPNNLNVNQDSDAIATRPTNFNYEVADGRRSGYSTWSKFGYNNDVGS